MYVFYKRLSETQGKVESVYQDNELTVEQKAQGIYVTGFPEVEKGQTVYIDLTTEQLSVVTEEPVESMADLKKRLDQAESKLQNPAEYYDKLDPDKTTLPDLKKAKSAQLEYLCDQAIAAGFRSASTGFLFGFDPEDQKNIQSQVILFLANPNKVDCQWKTEDVGVQTLTREQFMNLLPEGEAHSRANIGKLWQLRAQVEAAVSKDQVRSIRW